MLRVLIEMVLLLPALAFEMVILEVAELIPLLDTNVLNDVPGPVVVEMDEAVPELPPAPLLDMVTLLPLDTKVLSDVSEVVELDGLVPALPLMPLLLLEVAVLAPVLPLLDTDVVDDVPVPVAVELPDPVAALPLVMLLEVVVVMADDGVENRLEVVVMVDGGVCMPFLSSKQEQALDTLTGGYWLT